jgi:[ribosomal protein S18]-alanine N-acetyltransferase
MSTVAPDALDSIMAVMDAAFDPVFGEAWTRQQVRDALSMRGTHCLLADEHGDEPDILEDAVGFTLSRGLLDEEELLLLAVLPSYRGKGVGRRLLERFMKAAEQRGATRLFLEMRDGNKAELLYRAAGFVNVGRRRHYYRRGEAGPLDAITFALTR